MPDTATCSQCGINFEVSGNEKEIRRAPCPNCGSDARNIKIHTRETLHVLASVHVSLNEVFSGDFAPKLLLQTVIIPGDKNLEGQLVEAVAIPWFDIIDLLKKDPAVAFEIPYRKWEEIVAGAYSRAGFDEVTLTPSSGDYGRDIIAIKKGIGCVRVIDQVKAFKLGHLVTANDVRALMGVLQGDNASKGFLTTTSDFAPKLKDDPLIKPFIPKKLELINGANLLKRLEELARNREK